jgi:aminopeptidase
MDSRNVQLAQSLVNYSVKCGKGDKVYIQYVGKDTTELARAIIKEVYAAGGRPFVHFRDTAVEREILFHADEEQLKFQAKLDAAEMKAMDCFIGVRGADNAAEFSDVPQDRMEMYEKLYQTPVHMKIRVPKTRWVILRYPNASMAQSANMSVEAFEDFYYKVCCLDYAKMGKAMKALVRYMEKTDRVRMVGPDTDISFSIKGIPAIPCAGELNIPDGEVFTAPVKNSINGTISYNTPSLMQGFTFEKISLTFKDGKIVRATANDTERINKIFDMDAGARYVGEFSFGINPYVLHPMKDILFDEKISGSIHFTPGACYDEAPNGNHSALHWDLVWIQRKDYGGGEVYFDDKLIRKDGLFVVKELLCCNPENLK